MPDPEEKEKKPSAEEGLSEARERIRTTAQWMMVTFGAVAGVLVAGLQLTSLQDTVGDARTDALWGYGLAVGGTLLAILAAAITLTAGRRSLHNLSGTGGRLTLRKRLNDMTDLRAGFDSVADLVRRTNDAIRARAQAWLTLRADPENAEKKKAFDDAKAEAAVLVPLADRVTDVASFEHIRRTWAVCRVFVVGGAMVAAVGVAIFAVNAGKPKEEEEAALAQTPAVGQARFTAEGAEAHRATLGEGCRARRVAVIVTAADKTSYSVTVVPTTTNKCGPGQITLKRSEGSIKAREVVALE
jgi:hypothetical protein